MKITIDIHDELLARAKQHARDTGQPLRAVVEDGLRQVLAHAVSRRPYKLPDLRVGNPAADDPLEELSWSQLRETIYTVPSTCLPKTGDFSLLPEPPTGEPPEINLKVISLVDSP